MGILSHSLFFMPCKKLLIRPMLMRGRAQAFCFDESARSSRRSGISVSSEKIGRSHIATVMSDRFFLRSFFRNFSVVGTEERADS